MSENYHCCPCSRLRFFICICHHRRKQRKCTLKITKKGFHDHGGMATASWWDALMSHQSVLTESLRLKNVFYSTSLTVVMFLCLFFFTALVFIGVYWWNTFCHGKGNGSPLPEHRSSPCKMLWLVLITEGELGSVSWRHLGHLVTFV